LGERPEKYSEAVLSLLLHQLNALAVFLAAVFLRLALLVERAWVVLQGQVLMV